MGTGKNDSKRGIETLQEKLQSPKSLGIDIFRANEEKLPVINRMCEEVIMGRDPVTNKDRYPFIRILVSKVKNGPESILLSPRLYDAIQVPFSLQRMPYKKWCAILMKPFVDFEFGG